MQNLLRFRAKDVRALCIPSVTGRRFVPSLRGMHRPWRTVASCPTDDRKGGSRTAPSAPLKKAGADKTLRNHQKIKPPRQLQLPRRQSGKPYWEGVPGGSRTPALYYQRFPRCKSGPPAPPLSPCRNGRLFHAIHTPQPTAGETNAPAHTFRHPNRRHWRHHTRQSRTTAKMRQKPQPPQSLRLHRPRIIRPDHNPHLHRLRHHRNHPQAQRTQSARTPHHTGLPDRIHLLPGPRQHQASPRSGMVANLVGHRIIGVACDYPVATPFHWSFYLLIMLRIFDGFDLGNRMRDYTTQGGTT